MDPEAIAAVGQLAPTPATPSRNHYRRDLSQLAVTADTVAVELMKTVDEHVSAGAGRH